MRIGLVGYGHGGRFFHAPLTATLPSAANTRSMWERACPPPTVGLGVHFNEGVNVCELD